MRLLADLYEFGHDGFLVARTVPEGLLTAAGEEIDGLIEQKTPAQGDHDPAAGRSELQRVAPRLST